MATFEENLRKIRGEAVYGPDMRTAIADAIEQVDDIVSPIILSYEERVNTKVKGATDRMDAMQVIIDNHMWYVNVEQIEQTDDYLLSVTEGEVS